MGPRGSLNLQELLTIFFTNLLALDLVFPLLLVVPNPQFLPAVVVVEVAKLLVK